MPTRQAKDGDDSLATFACPNPDCDRFNQFNADNLSIVERMGKDKAIRRLYCNHCQHRFSERQGSLMQYTKLPRQAVVRIVKCLGYGCSVEAASDICDVDSRTVERMLGRAGKRAEDFHAMQVERLPRPPEVVEMDELHGRVCKTPAKKGARVQPPPSVGHGRPRPGAREGNRLAAIAAAAWAAIGFTRPWQSPRGS